MSREIKFRSWDGRQMREWGFLQSDNDRMYFQGIPTESGSFQYPQMQYTGLTDRNGVEIYEGDIVTIGGHLNQIDFYDGAFGCKMKTSFASRRPFLLKDIAGRCEVIGNIYENKDLLDAER